MRIRTLGPMAASCLALLSTGAAHAETDYYFSGFGTLGVAHSDNRGADYYSNLTQPNGPGASKSTSFGTDTKLGLQAAANFRNGLSAVVQTVFDHRLDNTYAPKFEWANLKYQFNEDWFIRVGRVQAPTFMVSDYRNVGYAQTAIRMPFDVYALNPQNHSDGIDIGAKFKIADGVLNAQFTAGRVKEKISGSKGLIASGDVKGREALVNFTYETGAHLARAGYGRYTMDTVPSPPDMVLLYENLAKTLGPAMGYPVPNIVVHDGRTIVWGVGYAYDPGNWLLQTEYVSRKGEGLLVKDIDAWYVLAGYRIGKFTPYASYSEAKDKEPGVRAPAVGGGPLGMAAFIVNSADALVAGKGVDKTASVGLRWDFYKNMALKMQYERIRKDGSPTSRNVGSVFTNWEADWPTSSQTVNLTSLVLDFVF